MQGRTARALGALPPRPLCSPRHALIRDTPCGRSLRPLAPTPALHVGLTVRHSFSANMPKRRAAEADTLAKRLLRCELVHLPCHCFPRQPHTSHARSVWTRADQGHSLRSLAPPARTDVLQVGWTARHPRQTCQKRRAAEADALAKRPLRCELVHLLCHRFPRQRHTSHARSVWARAHQGHSRRSLASPARTDACTAGGLDRAAFAADMPRTPRRCGRCSRKAPGGLDRAAFAADTPTPRR